MTFEQATTSTLDSHLKSNPIEIQFSTTSDKIGSAAPSAELKQANAFFERIKEKERASLKLPNLQFDVTEQGSGQHKTYVLNETQKPDKTTTITRPQVGTFHLDDNGNMTTSAQELTIAAGGSSTLRETNQYTDAKTGQVTTQVYEGPVPTKANQQTRLNEMSETTIKADGQVVSSTTFAYASGTIRETKVDNQDGQGSKTQIFEGTDKDHLKQKSEVVHQKDGSTISTDFAYAAGQMTETIRSKNADGTATTQVLAGPDTDGLKPQSKLIDSKTGTTSRTFEYGPGKTTETIIANDTATGARTTTILDGRDKDNLQIRSEVTEQKGVKTTSTFEYSGQNTTNTIVTETADGRTKTQVFAGKGDDLKPQSEVITAKTADGKGQSELFRSTFDYSSAKSTQTNITHNSDGSTATQVFEGDGAQQRLKSESIVTKAATQTTTMDDIVDAKQQQIGRRATVVKHDLTSNQITTSVFEGTSDDHLSPRSLVVTDANNKELKHATFENITDANHNVVGIRETLATHPDSKTLVTSIFEGSSQSDLSERERTIANNGKVVKHYVTNQGGDLVEKH